MADDLIARVDAALEGTTAGPWYYSPDARLIAAELLRELRDVLVDERIYRIAAETQETTYKAERDQLRAEVERMRKTALTDQQRRFVDDMVAERDQLRAEVAKLQFERAEHDGCVSRAYAERNALAAKVRELAEDLDSAWEETANAAIAGRLLAIVDGPSDGQEGQG